MKVLVILTFCASSLAWAQPYRVAILDEPSMPVAGHATPPATFDAALSELGMQLTRLSAARLADPTTFNADAFDCLIVPTGASFPLEAKDSLLAFLQKRGDLFCTGGYAFDHLMTRNGGGWRACEDLWQEDKLRASDPAISLVPNGGFESGSDGWASSGPSTCAVIAEDAYSGKACARVTNAIPDGGGCWEKALDVAPGKHYLVGIAAKSESVQGSGYAFLATYQHDAQGGLVCFVDFKQLRADNPWKRYEIPISVAPNATRVLLKGGLFCATGALYIDEATCGPLRSDERINAHYGIPGDGLINEPLQLPIYSPDQPIEGESLAASQESPISEDWRQFGPVRGFEATAQLRQSARWVPLIEARDAWNRPAGAAGALLYNYAGPFAHATFAFFGVDNRDIFDCPEGRRLLRDVFARLRNAAFIQGVRPNHTMRTRGEDLRIDVGVRNPSAAPLPLSVEIEFTSVQPDGAAASLYSDRRAITLDPASAQTIEFPWTVANESDDFVRVTATLRQDGGVQDHMNSGFCVRNERVVAHGTGIRYADNAFTLALPDGRTKRACLFGTDTYANMFGSAAQSPWTWLRDVDMMRDYGLHMFENLQFTPPQYTYSDEQREQVDALVQLAQRSGLPYMMGLLIGREVAIGDAELQQQARMCRETAARYKNVPGLIYYLNGDFQLRMEDDPAIRPLWNAFLQERYGSDEALRKAWRKRPPEAPLGQIPAKDITADAWFSVEARDMALFKAGLVKRWVHALCEAIRQEDAEHPITSEYYQRPYAGIDLRLSLDNMDAANFGYFDLPGYDTAKLLATIKWNDMRRAGKTVNIGEFGVKTHDAWDADRGGTAYHVRRSVEEQEDLFWWVAHAAWAQGVTKIQNWCWSDDTDRVFPWGLAWNNPLRAKPVLKMYRNLSLLSDQIEPSYARAEVVFVMPDPWRLGAPEQLAHTSIMNALECLLATNIPFDVANESDLAAMRQDSPRLVVMPLAYALPDDALNALVELAQTGATVYLSGDPSITPAGERDAARLESYLHARFEKESANAAGMPVPAVAPIDATRVENAANLAVFKSPAGKGALIWSPEPWECFPDRDLFASDAQLTSSSATNFYLHLVPMAGISPMLNVTADQGVWRAMLTPSGNNHLLSLFPRAAISAPVTVRAEYAGKLFSFDMRRGVPSQLLLDPQGNPLLASGSGGLSVDGRRLLEGNGNCMAVSLDGHPIEESERLALASTAKGTLRWHSHAPMLRAALTERQAGILRAIAEVPMVRNGEECEMEAAANELYLVSGSK